MKRTNRIILITAVIAVALFITAAYYFHLDWTGFGEKNLWDWMDLLIVPVVLAVGGLIYNRSEKKTEQRRQDARAKNDRDIAKDNQREKVLQDYISIMTSLLLEHELDDPKVKSIAKVRTAGIFERLDSKRKKILIGFLSDAGFIKAESPIISLGGVDLKDVITGEVSFFEVSFSGLDLSKASLKKATLRYCDLQYSDLSHADFSNADLYGCNFCGADLKGAMFSDTTLFNTDFSHGAHHHGATMSPTLARTRSEQSKKEWLKNLRSANFAGAKYDHATKWPEGFDPKAAGARYVET